MRWFHVIAVAMLVLGNTAFASFDNNERQELQTISSWMAHLNTNFPGLDVNVENDIQSPEMRSAIIDDLQLLEGVMHGDYDVPQGSLKQIACGKPQCGGGDGGKCKMCQ